MGFSPKISPKPPWRNCNSFRRNTLLNVFALVCFVCTDIFTTRHLSSPKIPKMFEYAMAPATYIGCARVLREAFRPAKQLCALKSTIGSIPRIFHDDAHCGSTFSALQANGDVCCKLCVSQAAAAPEATSNGCDAPVRAYRVLLPSESEKMTVSSERGHFIFPSLLLILSPDESSDLDFEVHSANENLYSLPESIPRNAGIRAALPTDEQQMTVVVPLTVKTSDLGAYSSIYTGVYPGSTTIKMPCGSTVSSLLADSGVCLELRRSGNHGVILFDAY